MLSALLFSREMDEQVLQVALAALLSVKAGAPVAIWPQYLGEGVLK